MVKARTVPAQDATSGCEAQRAVLAFGLPANMTIGAAEVLAGELKSLPLLDATHLTLDASQVANISTPCIQLLVALDKTLAAHGGCLSITGQGESFTHAFQDIGLGKFLDKPSS